MVRDWYDWLNSFKPAQIGCMAQDISTLRVPWEVEKKKEGFYFC